MGRFSGGVPTRSRPSRKMAPASGRSKPAIIRRSVVLPHPDGPSRVKNSPASMAMLTLSTAFSAPKRRVTSLISRSAMRLDFTHQRPRQRERERDRQRDRQQAVAASLQDDELA